MKKSELKQELDKLSKKSSVEELQKYIKDMVEVRGFRTSLLERMCLLTEEMGELAKEVRKTDNNLLVDVNKDYSSNLENEITDVFICLMGMCELLDMDIVKGLKNKEEIKGSLAKYSKYIKHWEEGEKGDVDSTVQTIRKLTEYAEDVYGVASHI